MKIPDFLSKDDYLQNSIMKRFLKEKGLKSVESRADYIKTLEEYANRSKENEEEIQNWILQIVREGTKEICYKKVYDIEKWHTDPEIIEKKIQEQFPNCPNKNILTYVNTNKSNMIEYHIIKNEQGRVKKVEFTYSKLALYGERGQQGQITIFPIFIELYLEEGFIVSRGKAKTTLYECENNGDKILALEYKIDTLEYADKTIDSVAKAFNLQIDTEKNIIKAANTKMLYGLYEEYTFTPEHVIEQVNSQKDITKQYIDMIFANLNLNVKNKEKAILDAQILVEKFISINGNNEKEFKDDREAYLIKVSADDESELTKIDTISDKSVPLQCTEAFFDSKRTVMKSKKCNKLNMIFKRSNELYLKNAPLVVQFGMNKNISYVKMTNYAEEDDIQHVLQAIFRNY